MAGDLGSFTIPVADAQCARAFYSGLLGWQCEPQANGYHITKTTPPGGSHAGEGPSPQVWFRVDDIQAALARVRELGGRADDPQESPSGWGAACRDDQGTRFNLWQPAPSYA